jgi:hypothetical protein
MAATEAQKKANKQLIIVIVVLALVLVAIYLYNHFKDKKGSEAPPDDTKLPPGGSTGSTTANDNFPLQKGSKGENVKYLQNAINKFVDKNNLNNSLKLTPDGSFGDKTYTSLVTAIGTSTYWDSPKLSIYPVSAAAFSSILKKAYNTTDIKTISPTLASVSTYS